VLETDGRRFVADGSMLWKKFVGLRNCWRKDDKKGDFIDDFYDKCFGSVRFIKCLPIDGRSCKRKRIGKLAVIFEVFLLVKFNLIRKVICRKAKCDDLKKRVVSYDVNPA